MKTSYSKILLSGIVATSFFLVSCQKKGSARGLTPQTATAPESTKEVNPSDTLTKNDTTTTDTAKHATQTKPADAAEVTKETPAPVEAKTDEKPTDPNAAVPITVEKPKEEKTTTKTGEVADKKQQAELKKEEEAKVKETKTDEVKIEECSSEIIKFGASQMEVEYKKIGIAVQKNAVTVEQKITEFSRYENLCKSWKTLFTDAKIKSCQYNPKDNKPFVVTPERYEINCQQNQMNLALQKVFTTKFHMSEEAQAVLRPENQGWNLFLKNGELLSDKSIMDDPKEKSSVACLFFTNAKEIPSLNKAVIRITEASEVTNKLGVNFGLKAFVKSDDQILAPIDISMSCLNVNMKKFDVNAFKKALGQHLVEEKAEQTK